MEPKKDWSINGVDYSEYEMKCIACVMLGLKPKQMPTCLCKSRGAIKYYLSYVYAKMNIHGLHELALLAPTKGFDLHGCFQGEPVLNPDELSRAYQLRPPIT